MPTIADLAKELVPQTRRIGSGRPVIIPGRGNAFSEKSRTVLHPAINNGQPTNIPTVFGGKVLSEQEAVSRIVDGGGMDPETGRPLPGFSSIDEAVRSAIARSKRLGALLQKRLGAEPVPSVPQRVQEQFFDNPKEELARILSGQ